MTKKGHGEIRLIYEKKNYYRKGFLMRMLLVSISLLLVSGCGLQENGKYTFLIEGRLVYRLDTATGEIVMIDRFGYYDDASEAADQVKMGRIVLPSGPLRSGEK